MSVIMTLSLQGDPEKLEEYAAANADEIRGIADTARGYGAIAHRFYGSDDGQIMVIDEWPDEQSFQTFFENTRDRIGPLMEAAGASSEPQVRFWRKLDTGDDIGWEG